ncbi:Bcgod1 [Botrytis cinerea B05.10]|uniref:Bcgod1 n=3 Tax=Botryotinia fuckeliana TaxID=40559 RepID=A0A384K3P1_BOTFB|nr:Bcgod1 [Botrytis cinerea B05.10]ATZ57408.1 Bcgod1 [Botrytis cinerea B05.10]EMR82995.1 putative glucose oxidase protein [Botrytis cinerea BcDW1]CAD88590.1 glucose oxidase [Botrytis cinerea]
MYRLLSTFAVASLAAASTDSTLNYDYIIVGAGTSGLVIANRLSELNVTVAVIEAGDSGYNNPNVTNPSGYGSAFGTDIDWAYQSINQKYAGNKTQTLRAGKVIGGTSTINGMAYTRAEDVQIDAWEAIGNDGWNWANLFPYYKKSQTLEIPTTTQAEAGATYDASANGFDGPLKVGWLNSLEDTNNFHTTLNDTYAALGVPSNDDVNTGKMVGYSRYPATYDSALNVRHDAGRAYYYPIANRTNLHLYPNTLAQRITWKSNTDTPTANGIEVLPNDSSTPYTIYANSEVILSAGALASPLLLELSGIGNPSILNEHNISVVVDLPTVGENLQDQTNTGLAYNSSGNTSFSGAGTLVAYPSAAQVFGSEVQNISAHVLQSLPSYAEQVSAASGNITKATDLLEFFKVQHDLIFSTTHPVPMAEILIIPSATSFSSEYWALLPFARGSIHITSSVAGEPAAINPNYYMFDWDITSQISTAKFIRSVFETSPFSSFVGSETKPGLNTVSANATEAEWFDWVKTAYRSNFHPVSTAAMMPREVGGVVDSKLKVYGTANVRVVDASILPMQVSGHLVSTLYAVAERAADLIKEDI